MIIPRKDSVPFLETQDLIRGKKECTGKRSIVYCMQPRPSFGFVQDFHGKDSEGKNQTLGQQKTMLWLLSTCDQ